MNLAAGDIFEQKYEVRSELGGGEFSVVYRATSLDSGRDVAIRILLPPPTGYPAGFSDRFLAEAELVSRLRHAGTVHLETFGIAVDGSLYLVTEFVSGNTLADAMASEDIPLRDALGVIKRMAESLAEAHRLGLIHRALKPENIAIPLRRGVLGAKLRDYGITKFVEQDGPINATAAGFGSPRYLSPEQILGEGVGVASNIYSLGLVMYELITREPCITATSSREILATHLSTTEFTIPSTVPPALVPVLKRMVAKSQLDRFRTTKELVDALSELDASRLGLTVQMKMAKMVEVLQATDDDGTNAGDTLVDPRFVEPSTDEQTKERFTDDKTAEDPAGASQADFVSPQLEDLTPTNVESDDSPMAIGSASEVEPTDELEGKKKPAPAAAKPASAKLSPQPAQKPGRPVRRTPPPRLVEEEEERVSGWFAVAAIVGAVAVALAITGGVLYLRSPSETQRPIALGHEIAPPAPLMPHDPTSPPPMIPAVAVDLGYTTPDLGSIPTGCGIARPLGWTTQKEVVGLTELTYETYVPKSYTGAPVPVILVVHPPGGYGKFWTEHTRLTTLAEHLGAILLVPLDKSLRPWIHDIAGSKREFDRVLDDATETFCVDQGRVFGVGMSTGAYTLDRYACTRPDRFRALGLVATWATPHSRCSEERRTASMVVNGLDDRVSPPAGGPGCWGGDVRIPLADMRTGLQKLHKCEGPSVWAKDPDGSCITFDSCDADLVMCEVPKAGHAWPGSTESVVRCLDELTEVPATTKFPTTELLERFFNEEKDKHPR